MTIDSEIILSIITVSFNSVDTIIDTLDSVASQTFTKYEHIVIDGNSTDGTIDILKSYSSPNLTFISEADDGIYYAMNKGIKLAKGKYIAILNSDDFFKDNEVLERLIAIFEKDGADIVYSGIEFINAKQAVIAEWMPDFFVKNFYRRGYNTPHPGFFATQNLYAELGLFDISMPIAADFDLMFRFMENAKTKCVRWPVVTVVMRSDGTSSSIKNIFQGHRDIFRAFGKENLAISIIPYMIRRYLPKLKRKLTTMINK
ncbi:glycosyltransferase [Planktomarina temperata]|nr:glycosyltransferase [Planktomarina temperata]MDB2459776.1 glycosyltransferase [Planktomarina temperata]